MTDTFEAKSADGTERVELKAVSRDFIAVTVTGANLSASAEVAHIGGGDGLNSYWADLAQSWRGWTGEKTWRSLEGDLAFSATSDRTGPVTLKVTLAYGAPWRWQTQAVLAIEAGQLDGLAAAALAFARYLGAAA
jgi:hypothetical protein